MSETATSEATAPVPFRASVRSMLRERILDAAADVIAEEGWAAVRMGQLAATVGVSRQTVYNEFGSKPQLAEALVVRELLRTLEAVQQAIAEATDLAGALVDGCCRALETIDSSLLAQAILRTLDSGGSELAPFLTTRSGVLVDASVDLVVGSLEEGGFVLAGDPERARLGIEAAVRLVISHLLQSPEDPELAARRLLTPLLPFLTGTDVDVLGDR